MVSSDLQTVHFHSLFLGVSLFQAKSHQIHRCGRLVILGTFVGNDGTQALVGTNKTHAIDSYRTAVKRRHF
jgi:hypothetical protein